MQLAGFLSILSGSFFSLGQTKIKRLLAFSSVSQIGFLLLIVGNLSLTSVSSLFIYLLIYSINILLLWTNLLSLRENFVRLTDFVGLQKKNLALSVSFLILLLSLAGMPPFSGFLSKLLIIVELCYDAFFPLVVATVIVSALSVLYYLKLVYLSFFKGTSNYSYNKFYLGLRKTSK